MKPNTDHDGLKKEFCIIDNENTIGQIYRNAYGKSVEYLSEFSQEALKDFPDTHPEVIVFDGISKKYVMGVRFVIPKGSKIPKDYFEFTNYYSMDSSIY